MNLLCAKLKPKNKGIAQLVFVNFEALMLYIGLLLTQDIRQKFLLYYTRFLRKAFKKLKLIIFIFILITASIILLFKVIKKEIAPKEDRGLVGVYLPFVRNIDFLDKKTKLVEERVAALYESQNYLVFLGDWGAQIVFPLKAHNQRKRSAKEIVGDFEIQVKDIPGIDIYPWSYDSALSVTNSSVTDKGLSVIISTTRDYIDLFNSLESIKKPLEDTKIFANVSHDLNLDFTNYVIELDKQSLAKFGIEYYQISKIIEVFFSSNRLLTFSKDGILYNIILEGKEKAWSLDGLYVVNRYGKRISLGSLMQMSQKNSPQSLYHYNQMRSAVLFCNIAANVDFDDALERFLNYNKSYFSSEYKQILPKGISEFYSSQHIMLKIFLLAIIFIYAILSVQFKNFIDPLIIIFTVPLACFGGLLLLYITSNSINIYSQIGFVTLVGLITKHGILIVEFVNKRLLEQGIFKIDIEQKHGDNKLYKLKHLYKLKEAIIYASSIRLRPILMTSGAMIFGAIPLVIASGAGAEAQRAIGIVLFGGLFFGTLFTLLILPSICYIVKFLEVVFICKKL